MERNVNIMTLFRSTSLCIIFLLHLNWNYPPPPSPTIPSGVGAKRHRRPLPRHHMTPGVRRSERIQTQENEVKIERIRKQNQVLELPRDNVCLPKGAYSPTYSQSLCIQN